MCCIRECTTKVSELYLIYYMTALFRIYFFYNFLTLVSNISGRIWLYCASLAYSSRRTAYNTSHPVTYNQYLITNSKVKRKDKHAAREIKKSLESFLSREYTVSVVVRPGDNVDTLMTVTKTEADMHDYSGSASTDLLKPTSR